MCTVITPKHAPYEGTEVSAEKTIGQIQQLLLDYGADAVQLHREKNGRVIFRFALEVEIKGVRRRLGIEIEPPMLTRKRTIKGRFSWETKTVIDPDPDRSMRCAYWYLKSKLEAVATGMATAEREFLAQVMVALPDGSESTVGNQAEDSIEKGAGFFLPGLTRNRLALPPPPEDA